MLEFKNFSATQILREILYFSDPEPKPLKHDPVKLYQFYQDQWKKQRLPGELNRTEKDIRWATREWMMGGPKS